MKRIYWLLFCLTTGFGLQAMPDTTWTDSCEVQIFQDTTAVGGSLWLFAAPFGTPPFTYQWSTGETTPFIEALESDSISTYCVTVTDAAGCIADACIDPDFDATWCYTYIEGQGNPSNSGFTLTAQSYGEAPFTYIWSTGEASQSITVLDAGDYCVSVVDALGCESSACYYYDGPNTVDSCWVFIYPDSTTGAGTVLWAQAGGTPPFIYIWDTGESTPQITVTTDGTYCLSVIDATGCVASACYYYSTGGNPDSCVATIAALSTPGGGADLCAYSTGPGPYTYQWSTGETSFIIHVDQPGDYCVTVTDAAGCVASTCYYYDGPNTNDSCLVYIDVYQDSTVSGAALLIAQAFGVPPFTYAWSTGELTQDILVFDAGIYCVSVTDAAGCVATNCFAYTPGGNPDSCYATIAALSTPGGGADLCAYSTGPGPYTYQWSTGETSFIIHVDQPGDYCVTVTDALGCVASTCYYYDGPNTNDSCWVFIEAFPDSTQNTGSVLVAFANGIPPFQYDWSNGETTPEIWVTDPGTYCVAVDRCGRMCGDCLLLLR